MRVADFFCGGGGFSEGFRQAGFDIVFAVDRWEPAINTYRGNKPGVNAIQDDVIRISQLNDEEFEKLVPDSEVIIGSPPCQAFSNSNKSGNGDKAMGIRLIEAYLRIIARKKAKPNSVLRFWVLENVPAVKKYIKEEYTAADLGMQGDVILHPHAGASGIYNAKYFGAPTNRKRYLCGEFPAPQKSHTDETVVTLRRVLDSLGEPLSTSVLPVYDVNYPDFQMNRQEITDHSYIYELASFEWETAKRLKCDKGYMGKMSFPENLNNPARTVMANMTASSREAMILSCGENNYRLPTVREVASMMSFPIDYRFYGNSRVTKHTLVGNAVPPKLSYAVAKAILLDAGEPVPQNYFPIHHDPNVQFTNLNGVAFPIKEEQPRKDTAKFKYHIPYLIVSAYRVELTNHHSDFEKKRFKWDVEIHHGQGKNNATLFTPVLSEEIISPLYIKRIKRFILKKKTKTTSFRKFQELFCMTTNLRIAEKRDGPYELLADIRKLIDSILLTDDEKAKKIGTNTEPQLLPQSIAIGYFILNSIISEMGGIA
jgi:DNA (cytosine-5)-methyltransferase 1